MTARTFSHSQPSKLCDLHKFFIETKSRITRRKVAPAQVRKAYGGVQVYRHLFITSAPEGSEWSASGPGCLTRTMYSVTKYLYIYRINQIISINVQTNLLYIYTDIQTYIRTYIHTHIMYEYLLISGSHRASLQSITPTGRPNATDYTKPRD